MIRINFAVVYSPFASSCLKGMRSGLNALFVPFSQNQCGSLKYYHWSITNPLFLLTVVCFMLAYLVYAPQQSCVSSEYSNVNKSGFLPPPRCVRFTVVKILCLSSFRTVCKTRAISAQLWMDFSDFCLEIFFCIFDDKIIKNYVIFSKNWNFKSPLHS